MQGFESKTIEGALEELLFNHGLFDNQAKAVVDRVKSSSSMKNMDGRWNESHDEYPDAMFKVLWLVTKTEAVSWIDENMPKYWARPLFTDELVEKVNNGGTTSSKIKNSPLKGLSLML